MRADARARREDDLRASLRCDEHFRVAMRNFEEPCDWTQVQCWETLATVMDYGHTPPQERANVKQVRQ